MAKAWGLDRVQRHLEIRDLGLLVLLNPVVVFCGGGEVVTSGYFHRQIGKQDQPPKEKKTKMATATHTRYRIVHS